MKKERKILSIIISLFMLNFFMLMPTSFAASSWEDVIEQYELKEKVGHFLMDAGRIFIKNLSDARESVGSETAIVTGELQGKVIVIDAGHGGYNPGAVRYGYREADNNLAVALKVEELLKAQGAKVVMTRIGDVSLVDKTSPLRNELQARVDITRNSQADIFVSIHTNSSENEKIDGAMTFYYGDEDKNLARSIQNGMISATNAVDKGTAYGDFLVLRNNDVPAVLVEMGFISNKDEAKKLSEDKYRQSLANGIAKGIKDYFKNAM